MVRLRFGFRKPIGDFHQPQPGHAGTQISYRQAGCADAIRQGSEFPLGAVAALDQSGAGHNSQSDDESRPPAAKFGRGFDCVSEARPCERVVVGLDGGYVRSRHRRPGYNFEVVAGKVLARALHSCAMADRPPRAQPL
jgi:hypothetical protein